MRNTITRWIAPIVALTLLLGVVFFTASTWAMPALARDTRHRGHHPHPLPPPLRGNPVPSYPPPFCSTTEGTQAGDPTTVVCHNLALEIAHFTTTISPSCLLVVDSTGVSVPRAGAGWDFPPPSTGNLSFSVTRSQDAACMSSSTITATLTQTGPAIGFTVPFPLPLA